MKFVLLWSLTVPAFASVIYTWVDKDGVTHYSQQAPVGIKATKIYSEDMEPAKVGYIAPKVRVKAQQQPSEMAMAAAAIKEKDAEQAKSICSSAKHSLNVLTSHAKLNRQDIETGKSVAMSEEERQAEIAEQNQRISLFCDE